MDKRNNVREFIQGSSILVIANVALRSMNFFLLPLYTEYLSPQELGINDSITSFTSLLYPILVMGLDSAFSAFFYDEKTDEHKRKVLNTIWYALIALSFIPITLMPFSQSISHMIFKDNRYYLAISVSLFSISVNLSYLPFSLLLRMQNRMRSFAIINVIASISMIVLNIVFVVVFDWGYFSLIASTLISHVIQLVLYLLSKTIDLGREYYSRELHKRMLKYSLPLVPAVMSSWALNLSDRYIILHYLGTSVVGIYGVAARFSALITVFSGAIYTAYTSFAFSIKDQENAKDQFRVILQAFFFVTFGICFTGSLFGKEIIELMTEQRYWSSYQILPGVLFGQVIYGVYTIVGYGISFAKKTVYSLLATLCGAMASIGLNLIFVPLYGVVAASNINFISFTIMCLIGYYLSQKVYPCEYGITKILLVTFAGYTCIFFTYEMDFKVKLFIWMLVLMVGIMLFRNVFKEFKILFKGED